MPLDIAPILSRLDWERQHVALGGEFLEPAGEVVRMWTADGSHHVIIWSNLSPANADAVIDREVAWHKALGASFEWKVYSHDDPPDLKNRLAARGFAIGEKESVMIMGIKPARKGQGEADKETGRQGDKQTNGHGSEQGRVAGSVNRKSQIENCKSTPRVECVRSPEQVEVFKNVAEEVFGGDWSFTAGQLLAGIERGNVGHRGYIGSLGQEAVSVGRLYVHPDSWFAGLYGGGTRPAFRGRGVYRAVVAARARDAIEWGAKYLMVDARETSRAILERMGFEKLGETWPCVFQ